eukprot:1159680-Pelagomonas_calceolata.AAC.11
MGSYGRSPPLPLPCPPLLPDPSAFPMTFPHPEKCSAAAAARCIQQQPPLRSLTRQWESQGPPSRTRCSCTPLRWRCCYSKSCPGCGQSWSLYLLARGTHSAG